MTEVIGLFWDSSFLSWRCVVAVGHWVEPSCFKGGPCSQTFQKFFLQRSLEILPTRCRRVSWLPEYFVIILENILVIYFFRKTCEVPYRPIGKCSSAVRITHSGKCAECSWNSFVCSHCKKERPYSLNFLLLKVNVKLGPSDYIYGVCKFHNIFFHKAQRRQSGPLYSSGFPLNWVFSSFFRWGNPCTVLCTLKPSTKNAFFLFYSDIPVRHFWYAVLCVCFLS